MTSKIISLSPTGRRISVEGSKTIVGLENVDNVSDINKPISTATQAAIDSKIGDAPIDGSEYVRKNGGWVLNTGGSGSIPHPQSLWHWEDFVSANSVVGDTYSNGSIVTSSTQDAQHIGVVSIRNSNNTINSGGRIAIANDFVMINQDKMVCKFQITASNLESLIGFIAASGSYSSTLDGIYASIDQSRVMRLTRIVTTPTNSTETFTLSINTWYSIVLTIGGSGSVLKLYNDSGVLLQTFNVSGVPLTTLTETGVQCVAKTAVAQSELLRVDYLGLNLSDRNGRPIF